LDSRKQIHRNGGNEIHVYTKEGTGKKKGEFIKIKIWKA
jgi:hypothetical protein